jgi:hypothetical protein
MSKKKTPTKKPTYKRPSRAKVKPAVILEAAYHPPISLPRTLRPIDDKSHVCTHKVEMKRIQGVLDGALIMYGASTLASIVLVFNDVSILSLTVLIANIIAAVATAHAADQHAKKH